MLIRNRILKICKKIPRTVFFHDSRFISFCMKPFDSGFFKFFIMVPFRPQPLPDSRGWIDLYRNLWILPTRMVLSYCFSSSGYLYGYVNLPAFRSPYTACISISDIFLRSSCFFSFYQAAFKRQGK